MVLWSARSCGEFGLLVGVTVVWRVAPVLVPVCHGLVDLYDCQTALATPLSPYFSG